MICVQGFTATQAGGPIVAQSLKGTFQTTMPEHQSAETNVPCVEWYCIYTYATQPPMDRSQIPHSI